MRPRLHQLTLTTTVIQILSYSILVRGRRRYGILTITFALAARSALRCGLAGTWRVWRILIATVIQISSYPILVRGGHRYGILTITCASLPRSGPLLGPGGAWSHLDS